MTLPREILLNKVPFPLPTPGLFNLDLINAFTSDTVVSENGWYSSFKRDLTIFLLMSDMNKLFRLWLSHSFIASIIFGGIAALTFDDLGIVPHKLKGYPIEFLLSYRKGGPQFGSTISERVDPEAFP